MGRIGSPGTGTGVGRARHGHAGYRAVPFLGHAFSGRACAGPAGLAHLEIPEIPTEIPEIPKMPDFSGLAKISFPPMPSGPKMPQLPPNFSLFGYDVPIPKFITKMVDGNGNGGG